MIQPIGEWKRFECDLEKILFFRRCGIHLSLAVGAQQVLYGHVSATELPRACEVIGSQCKKWAIIQIGDEIGCIHGEYLADMQIIRGYPFENIRLKIPKEYIVLDTETTGLSPKTGKMIEIAAIKYHDGCAVDEFVSLIDPKQRISPSITRLTGITQAAVDGQPEWKDIRESFFDFIGNTPIVGHNLRFDLSFIEAQSERYVLNAQYDTLALSRKIFPGLPCHKLEYLKNLFDLSNSGSHRAKSDVETTNSLLTLLAEVSKEL